MGAKDQGADAIAGRWLTIPSTVTAGETFTATLGVSNSGEALAKSIAPVPDPALVTIISGSGSLSGAPTELRITADHPGE